MSFRKTAILLIAGLTAACSGPASQSVNPATFQSAAAPDHRVKPDACGFVKMEQTQNRIQPQQKIGIWEYLRWPMNGVCQSLKLPASWSTTGGRLIVKPSEQTARFAATRPGTYYISATVNYNGNDYTGQASVTVLGPSP